MPTRRALLIGIGRYANPDHALAGPAADARLMARALVEGCGFAEADLRLLLDEQATLEGIRAALAALLEQTGPGDGALLFYAGHGSQRLQTAPEGEEPDGWEEVLVPHDSGRGAAENRDLGDDELAAWLEAMGEKTHELLLIFDCCHSGSLDRREDGRRLPADRRRRAGPRPARRGVRGGSGWLPLSPRHALLAACRDDEVAREIDTPDGRHGALSWHLARALLDPGARALGADALFERVVAAVLREVPTQHPQREGDGSRALFGADGPRPAPGLALGERAGEEIPLLGGAIHGVRPGSIWAVVGVDGAALGELEIASVQPLSALGRLRAPLAGDLSGARALERSRPPAEGLAVALEPGVPAELRAGLERALAPGGLVRLVEDAPLRVRWLPAREDLGAGCPCPELGALERDHWAALRREELLFPPLDATAPEAPALLAANLERAARVDRLLSLENPDPWSGLDGRVRLVLLRYDAAGLVEAAPDPASGLVRFVEGEPFSVAVENGSDREIWAALLDVGLLGAITPLWRRGPIPPGGREVVDRQRRLRLGFPAGYERLRDREGRPPRSGTEHLVLLAGTAPIDPTPLASAGYASRDVVGLTGGLDEDWTVALRAFTLDRSGP